MKPSEIEPVAIHAAVAVALDLPDTATVEDMEVALDALDGAGALRALQMVVELLKLEDIELEPEQPEQPEAEVAS